MADRDHANTGCNRVVTDERDRFGDHVTTVIPTEYARVNSSASRAHAHASRGMESSGHVDTPPDSTSNPDGNEWSPPDTAPETGGHTLFELRIPGMEPANPPVVAMLPAPPTTQQGLVALYLLADWQRILDARGYGPAPNWFKTQGVVAGLSTLSRKTALRLARIPTCLGCTNDLAANSTGDHIIPVARGGVEGLENYIPLCGRCNSSKGTSDLLDWWHKRGADPSELPPDVLVSYCRIVWHDRLRCRKQNDGPSEALAAAVISLAQRLPGDQHRYMLRQRVSWITGSRW